jgi:hypothetical protein
MLRLSISFILLTLCVFSPSLCANQTRVQGHFGVGGGVQTWPLGTSGAFQLGGWTRRSESDPLAAQKVIHPEA